jgi:hypothetical protein
MIDSITPKFRLPTNRQRVAVMGRTGSGKTQFAAWLLSQAPFDKQPYVIIDYKGDDLLNASDRIREISLTEIPRHAGVYIVHPLPSQAADVEAWLWKVWERERIGIYADEAYVLPDKGALQAVLTQGRSKHIPAIMLTQRPTWISRFVFSEADFYAVFHLQDQRDRQIVQAFMPAGTLEQRLPPFYSWWYDVGSDKRFTMQPVPDADTILDTFDARLAPKRKRI